MKKIIYSTVGAVIVILGVCILNYIGTMIYTRVDLTENRVYTLSDSSRKIIAGLDTPVTIKLYYSKSNPRMPVFLKNFAKRVEDLLYEYQQNGNGNIVLEKLDPEPDSDAEDSAIMDGVEGKMLKTGDKIYCGIAVSCLDKTASLPFLSPNQENLLEYNITRAITEVFNAKKKIVGVMSALPVMESAPTPAMMRMGQHRPSPAWLAIKELKQTYTLKGVPLTAEKIDPEIQVLLIIHPSGISEKTQFAIDQYILGGGKVIAYLDPKSFYAISMMRQQQQAGGNMMGKMSSNMDKLLKAWGMNFDTSKVVEDAVFGRTVQGNQHLMSLLDIKKDGFNKDDVVSSQLDSLSMVFAGAFTGTPVKGLKKTILVQSSENASLINVAMAGNPNMERQNFNPDGKHYALAVRLSGKFKTAFPNGKPGIQDDKTDKDKKKKEHYLKESKTSTAVVLVGDSDTLINDVCVRMQSIFGQRFMTPVNDDINFLQNLADNMSGDNEMIGIRCRPVADRPFEKIKRMKAAAEEKFNRKIKESEKELMNTRRRLNELQKRKKNANQRFILSPEQKLELQKFKTKQVKIRKDLKKYRKELRREIDSLEVDLKWFNIAAMPLLIIIFGIGMAIRRKKRCLR